MPEVIITGLPGALAEFSEARFAHGFAAGAQEVGELVAVEARAALGGHRYTGRLEAAINVRSSGESIASVTTEIGVNDAEVPEAAPLAFGWRSHSGHQPPAAALGTWAKAKGIGGDMSESRLGFVLARAIRQHGFDFEPLHPFQRAWAVVGPRAAEIIGAAIGRTRA